MQFSEEIVSGNSKRITAWVGLLMVTALFFPLAWLLPRQSLFGVEDSAIICTVMAIAVVSVRAAWRALRKPFQQINRGQSILSGLFLASLALAMLFAIQWYWRLTPRPDSIVDSLPAAFSRHLLEVGLLVILTGIWSTQSTVVAGGAYQRSAVVIALSVFISALVLLWVRFGG